MSHRQATDSKAAMVMAGVVLAVLLAVSACDTAPDGMARRDTSQAAPYNHNAGYNRSGP